MDGRCAVDGKEFNNRSVPVKCSVCNLHAHTSCTTRTKSSIDSESSPTITCNKCLGVVLEGEVKDTPVTMANQNEDVNNKSADFDIVEQLKNLSTQFDQKFSLLKTIHNDLSSMARRVSDVEVKQKDHEGKMQTALKEIEAIKEEARKATATAKDLSDYGRRNTVEIHGVPEDDDENMFEIIKDIGKAVNLTIKEEHIDAIHRLPSKRNKPIIVRFCNRWMLDKLKEARKGKLLNANQIGYVENSRIFINVSLSKSQSYLAMLARNFFKQYDCKVKANDSSNLYVIKWYKTKEEAREAKPSKHFFESVDDFSSILEKLGIPTNPPT